MNKTKLIFIALCSLSSAGFAAQPDVSCQPYTTCQQIKGLIYCTPGQKAGLIQTSTNPKIKFSCQGIELAANKTVLHIFSKGTVTNATCYSTLATSTLGTWTASPTEKGTYICSQPQK